MRNTRTSLPPATVDGGRQAAGDAFQPPTPCGDEQKRGTRGYLKRPSTRCARSTERRKPRRDAVVRSECFIPWKALTADIPARWNADR